MSLARREDWPERLAALVERRRGETFAWGGTDCVALALDAVEAVTGVDVLPGARGAYDSEEGALAYLRTLPGHTSLLYAANEVLRAAGIHQTTIGLAGRGDVVAYLTGADRLASEVGSSRWGAVLGICLGQYSVVPLPGSGIRFAPTARADRAWEV